MAFKAPFSLVFLDGRDKNNRALPRLHELGVSSQPGRRLIIEGLVVADYCEGPLANRDPAPHGGDLWVFGKDIRGEPYYLKLQIGHTNRSAICVSFHPAEYELRFPFKH